jgi:hypothetical protein
MNYLLILVYSFLFLTAFTCQKNPQSIEQLNFGTSVSCRIFSGSEKTICKFQINKDVAFCKQGETKVDCTYFDIMGE